MFAYIRVFMAASLIAVLIISSLVWLYFRQQMIGNAEDLAQNSNTAISSQFYNHVWDEFGSQLAGNPSNAGFNAASEKFIRDTGIYGLRVYSASGQVLFSSGGALAPQQFETYAKTVAARPMHQLAIATPADSVGGLPQSKADMMMLRGFVQLGQPSAEAYLEIFYDISSQWKRMSILQWIPSGAMVLISVLLLSVLVLTSSKAEAIIAKQHEEKAELAAQAASAQAENREKSQFLANISHELRTPLNAIIGFSEIIKQELMGEVENQRYRDYIIDIHTSGVHLLSLINDILDFSKAEAGKLELEIEEANASRMVSNCIRLVQPRAEASNVEMINAVPKENFVLETDGKKLKQVLLNLLSNAVKFTPPGGKVRVTAWRDITNDHVVFEVADTGIGIAAKDIAKALSPFGQVDSALSRRYEGTGLGLPLARKFVELMGGKFTIQSELNVGTTITFSLPRAFKPYAGAIFKRIA